MQSFTRLVPGFFLLTGIFIFTSCTHKKTLFEKIPSANSGIHFNNEIIENDSINPLDLTNIYNGGGVGIGDFNRDGLPDIYFTGNTVSNKLYLNRGDFKFDGSTSSPLRFNGTEIDAAQVIGATFTIRTMTPPVWVR